MVCIVVAMCVPREMKDSRNLQLHHKLKTFRRLSLEAHLKRRAARRGNACHIMRLKLHNRILDAAADWGIVQSTGHAIVIQHPGSHPAIQLLMRHEALHSALGEGPGGERLQDGHLS